MGNNGNKCMMELNMLFCRCRERWSVVGLVLRLILLVVKELIWLCRRRRLALHCTVYEGGLR